jgi:hypothetical protein
MKFEVSTDYLAPITIGPCEWVDVVLPGGRQVTVFADEIRVATEQDVFSHKDGKRIWEATAGPYGKVIPLAACTECGGAPVVARGRCGTCYKRWQRAQEEDRSKILERTQATSGEKFRRRIATSRAR